MSNSIEAAFPERAAQIKAFKAALGSCGKELILVSGPPLTGKTSVVREVLAQIGNPVVYVDGRECASERDLFVTAAAKLGSGSASKLKGSAQDIVDEMLEGEARSEHPRSSQRVPPCAARARGAGALSLFLRTVLSHSSVTALRVASRFRLARL